MPNIKSAKKRVELSKVAYEKNKAEKSALKTTLKKFEAAVDGGDRAVAEGAYKLAVKAVDQAAVKGLLHKNNAARKGFACHHQSDHSNDGAVEDESGNGVGVKPCFFHISVSEGIDDVKDHTD